MLFNSAEFLAFFPVVVVLYYLAPKKLKSLFLLAASYYFYMGWNAVYALLLLFSTAVTYASGIVLERIKLSDAEETVKQRRKKLCVAASFMLNLAVLFYFKYANWTLEMLDSLCSLLKLPVKIPVCDILLPVGISFYTFQALSYTIDVYRNNISAEKSFIMYALFVSFFPQLVAGPIERSGNLLGQLKDPKKFSFDNLRDGVFLMLWGFFMKVVVADRISVFVDAVYSEQGVAVCSGSILFAATALFSVQILCDFSGYSCIAMGAAKVLGIELMDNFNAPYFAASIAEYWRRWHISLSSWFRDYLYIPLGGNRKGKARKYLNILITFAVSGLWHGASLHYLVWGLIHGIYQIIGDILTPLRKRVNGLLCLNDKALSHRLVRIAFTFLLIVLGFVFFRAGDMRQAAVIMKRIFTVPAFSDLTNGTLLSFGLSGSGFAIVLFGILLMTVADICKYNGIVVRHVIEEQEWWFQILVVVVSFWVLVLLGKWGNSYDANAFIYFQF